MPTSFRASCNLDWQNWERSNWLWIVESWGDDLGWDWRRKRGREGRGRHAGWAACWQQHQRQDGGIQDASLKPHQFWHHLANSMSNNWKSIAKSPPTKRKNQKPLLATRKCIFFAKLCIKTQITLALSSPNYTMYIIHICPKQLYSCRSLVMGAPLVQVGPW